MLELMGLCLSTTDMLVKLERNERHALEFGLDMGFNGNETNIDSH